MDELLADLRYTFRFLRANPGLVAVAVLSLAVGIGPNAALFSVVDALGFRPLPVRDPGSLLQVTSVVGGRTRELSYPDYRDLREKATLLADVVVGGPQMFNVAGDGQAPEVVVGAFVSGDYFGKLGVRPAIGRAFLPQEDRTPGTHMVAMISERLWKRRFAGDPAIAGRTIRLTREDCTIVGVVPAGFNGTSALLVPDVWIPAMAWPVFDRGVEATLRARNRRDLTVLARLAPGASLEAARAQLGALASNLACEGMGTACRGTGAGSADPHQLAFVLEYEQAARRRPLAIAGSIGAAIAGLVLLVACANVAGLLLGRAGGRSREIALRLAFGASRRRLVRQLLTESAVLSLLAAATGLALAFAVIRLLPSLVPATGLPLNFDFRLDFRVLALTLVVALSAVPFFGLAPALIASRPDLLPLLKGDAPASVRARLPLRRLLVVAQIAVAVVLLVGSGFLLQSFLRARRIDPGFVPRPMVFSTIVPGGVGYAEAQAREYYRLVLERVSDLPGVERASLARHIPLNSLYGGGATLKVVVPGQEPAPGEEAPAFRFNIVTAGYFETMGTRILRGRDFADTDVAGGPGVVIVNETMARRFWGEKEPVGASFEVLGPGSPPSRRAVRVVGVARDAKYVSLTESPAPYFYLPMSQEHRGEVTLAVRYAGKSSEMVARLRRELLAVDAAVPVLQIVTLDEHLRLALAAERAITTSVGAVGGLGLALSLVGLYGVISFLVARRTREIGIRMALGARHGHVVAQIVREGGRLALLGVGIGLAAGAGLMQVAAGAMYGVNPADPLVFVATGMVVLAVALAASWIPARHAARVDPLTALRNE